MVRRLEYHDLYLDNNGDRRVGMRKSDLPFASLHGDKGPKGKNGSKSGFQMPVDVAIDAPPISSSDSDAGSENHGLNDRSLEISDPDSTRSRKRGLQENVGSRKKRCVSVEDKDWEGNDDECMKSNVRPTVFSNSNSTHEANWSRFEFDDCADPFKEMSSSQPSKTYHSRWPKPITNIHSRSSPISKRTFKKPKSAPSSQSTGFKIPSDAASKALDRRKEDEMATASSFKAPPALERLPLEGDKRRRSIRNQCDLGNSLTPGKPPKYTRLESKFKTPAPNPLAPAFRAPPKKQQFAEYSLSKTADIVKDGLVSLGVNLKADTTNAPSSLPSARSIIPENVSETSSISNPPSSADLEADRQLLDLPDSPTTSSQPDAEGSSEIPIEVCPACKISVSKDLITVFHEQHESTMPDGRIPWRLQKAFCRMHIANTAWNTWKERGYPDIDWDSLPRRLEQHETVIEGILVGKRQSHHRRLLEEKVKSGRKITFVRSLANSEEDGGCQTGYYGSKGAGIMMDHLIKTFSNLLGELNNSDKLISAGGGVSAYVQAVLVPELATVLIKEDMGVNEKRAREIIKESAALGELVNEEEGDVVDVEEVERKRLQDVEERQQERALQKEQGRQKKE